MIGDINFMMPDEQIFSTATLDDDFRDDSVIVILTTEASRNNRDFTARDFRDIGAAKVEDLNRLSVNEYSYVEPVWTAQDNMETMAHRDMANRNITEGQISSATYEAIRYYETVRIVAEENTLVNVDKFRRILLITLTEPGKENVLRAISILEQREDVRHAGPNYTGGKALFSTTPNDPRLGEQWAIDKIDLPRAWDITTGCSSIIVGVIDTGINGSHEDLRNRVNAQLSRDFSGANTNGLVDSNGHGTHVAGIIGAEGNNGIGIAGANWDVQLVSLRALEASVWGPLGRAPVVMAVNHARVNNIPILNASLEIGTNDTENQAIRDAVAVYSGLFIQAAGNGWSNTNNNPKFFGFPNVIVVGSTDINDNRSNFSDVGSTSTHIFAPGTNILSTHRDGYIAMDGTSMAAPYVAGVAALAMSANPDLSPQQKRAIILSTVDTFPALEDISCTGGRLNAYRAVRFALDFPFTLTPSGRHTFPAANVGYGAQTPHSVTVFNTGNRPTGNLTVALSGTNASSFTLNRTSIPSLAIGATQNFTVVPRTGLASGIHRTTVTVSDGNRLTQSFQVGFNVLPTFIDVPPSHWAHGYISLVAGDGIMLGTGYGNFSPNININRASFAVLLGRMHEVIRGDTIPRNISHNFTDLTRDWYRNYVAWASARGIIEGVGNNRFDPYGNITREQLATMLFRYETYRNARSPSGSNDLNRFTDRHNISDWATDAMAWAVGSDIITGTTPTTLAPLLPVMRSETATMIHRYMRSIQSLHALGGSANISLSPANNHTFPAATVGYGTQSTHTRTVINAGNRATDHLTVTLSGANQASFQLNNVAAGIHSVTVDSLSVGGRGTFTVRPRTGLTAGTHTATVTVSGVNVATQSFTVSFTVNAPAATFGISLNPANNHTFPTATIPYTAPAARSIAVSNTGNQPTGNLTVALSGTHTNSFTLNTTSLASIPVGNTTRTFTVRPRAGLAAGTHTATVTVSGASVVAQSFTVSFTVMPSLWDTLRDAINAAPANVPTTIQISGDIQATGSGITIPANRNITLVSSNATRRTLTQTIANSRHFTISNGASLTLGNNITLSGGTSPGGITNRGGVLVNGTFNMQAGSIIQNNRAATGGGVGVSATGVFNMSGGIIEGNVAGSAGDGVHLAEAAIFSMSGSSQIRNNGTRNQNLVRAVSSVAGLQRGLSSAPTLTANNPQKTLIISSNITLPNAAHTVQNHANVLLQGDSWYAFRVLTQTNNQRHFTVSSGGTLTLGQNITLSGGASPGGTTNRGGVLVNGRFNMQGNAAILNNRAANGGGVDVGANGVFTMSGGTIQGNTATTNGGGIRVSATAANALTITGGTLQNNHTTGDGGAIFAGASTLTVNPLPANSLPMLNIHNGVIFSDNVASRGAFMPPSNASAATRILATSSSVPNANHPLNNMDINYRSGAPVTVNNIGLTPTSNHTFPVATAGYGVQTAHTRTVNNTGIQPTGQLTVTLSGANPGSFQLNNLAANVNSTTIPSIAVNGSTSFTVRPTTGLSPGTYTATVTVSGASVAPRSFTVSFTVAVHPSNLISVLVLNECFWTGDTVPAANVSVQLWGGGQTFTRSTCLDGTVDFPRIPNYSVWVLDAQEHVKLFYDGDTLVIIVRLDRPYWRSGEMPS
ncbi:MAG: S8 family serine peptidase [Oscillospiraceae bacterium]|nr:S8 family serine peptidase [Oscillospiraceae bacterium]